MREDRKFGHLATWILIALMLLDSFRWAACQLVALVQDTTSEDSIRDALQTVSPGLDSLYTTSLLAFSTAHGRLLRFALFWLTFALRPLHLDELSEAMTFGDECSSIKPSARLFPQAVEEILKRCRMLIHYNCSSKLAILAHSSVREYLLSEQCQSGSANAFYLNPVDAVQSIMRRSIDYLNMPEFASGYCLSEKKTQGRYKKWPLFEYVSAAWPAYAGIASSASVRLSYKTEAAFLRFFESYQLAHGGNFGAWVQAYLPRHTKDGMAISTPLYYAAREGLDKVVQMILRVDGKKTLEQPGGSRQSTPLHVASAFGHLEVVRVLLQAGADPNEVNGRGERGIEWAMLAARDFATRGSADHSWFERDEVVLTLLTAGAVPVNNEEFRVFARNRGFAWEDRKDRPSMEDEEDFPFTAKAGEDAKKFRSETFQSVRYCQLKGCFRSSGASESQWVS